MWKEREIQFKMQNLREQQTLVNSLQNGKAGENHSFFFPLPLLWMFETTLITKLMNSE